MSFPLAGNSKICQSIENALEEHRLPHAILIDGDVGTGRHTLSAYLSRAIVCSGEKVPCFNCHNCHLASDNNHPDITVLVPEEGKKSISVKQIRQLKANAYIKPHTANSKVFVIDYADTLNEESQNALLKVLEEPPQNTFFILIAESKASLLTTVISRSVTFSLNVPTSEEALDYISSKTSYQTEDIVNVLKDTRNNIGRALEILKGNSDAKTSHLAKEFLQSALRGDQWGMLNILIPFEKNRVETSNFFKDLKIYVVEEIKKNPKSVRASSLSKFYDTLLILEKSLVTNINLPLLFADLVAVAKKHIS